MKNYKVKAVFDFNDTAEKNEYGGDTPRKAGNIWNCTKERYEFLKSKNAVELVGIDEIKPEPKPEPKEEVKEEPKTEVKETKVKKETKKFKKK